ncbi:MAG: hypothetical protein WCY48_11605 [Candidatus Caldatribacteriota bacterium]
MVNYIAFLSKTVSSGVIRGIALLALFICPNSWAAQEAIVVSDKAIIYSTLQMQAPIGYVSRGKKVTVGEVPRNNNRVYPIVVSGKIAYIKARDISFELDQNQGFTATRFYELTKETYNTHYSLGFVNYSSQSQSKASDVDESFNWYGYQLKGETYFKSGWGANLFTTGMWATKGEEQYRSIELGFGVSYMLFELRKLKLNFFMQALGIPFANYARGTKFRVNGGGYGGGLGMSATYDVQTRWGVEGSFGIYHTRLMGFDTPENFESPEPKFSGARTVLSAYYRF